MKSCQKLTQVISSLKENQDRCVFGTKIIQPMHSSITYQRRWSTEDEIFNYIQSEENLSSSDRCDKRAHSLGVMSALSGFGKTRLLLELPNLFNKPHWKFLYITYNSGFEENATEQIIDSSVVFAWRLLYFYFSPKEPWNYFMNRINPFVQDLDLPTALKYISEDMKLRSPDIANDRVVIIITIDEFQLLSENNRLRGVVQSIVNVMHAYFDECICVPLFSGLFLQPFIHEAQLSSIQPKEILLTPLSYDNAEEILFSLSGNHQLIQNYLVQEYVWKLSFLPACLVNLYVLYRRDENWEVSYNVTRQERFHKIMERQLFNENMIRLVALSITKLSPASSYCPVQFLESSGLCWFQHDKSIEAPYAILEILAFPWHDNLTRSSPPKDFQTAFQETVAHFVRRCSDPRPEAKWMKFEFLCWTYTALRMNCFGLLLASNTKIDISILLRGAFLPPVILEGSSTAIPVPPITVAITPIHLTALKTPLCPNSNWDTERSFYAKTCNDQDIIDAYGFFPNCKQNDIVTEQTDIFDLFLFQQMKYRPEGGMVPAVYETAQVWCRDFVSRYTQLSGRKAGFIFGVIDPLKNISPRLKTFLGTLIDHTNKEFYFAIGRDESVQYFGIFHDHPIFLPGVYINNPTLEANHLSMLLPWTYPKDQAKRILNLRPLEGYRSWNQIVQNAKILDDDQLDDTQIPEIKLTVFSNPG